MARAGLGEPFVVTGPEEAESAAASFREYIQSPVLTGIEVDVRPASTSTTSSRRASRTCSPSRPLVVFGKWRGRAEGRVELRGRTGTEAYEAAFPVSEADAREDHQALRYLWARARIADLSDFATGGDSEREAVTQLGLTYNLLTRYTSFIAVHEVIRNEAGLGQKVQQALPLPAGVSDLAVGVQAGAEPELAYVALALLARARLRASRATAARMGGCPVTFRRAVVLALIAAAMYGLKRHYSAAAVEDLRWILGPTSALVGAVSGSAFEFEAGGGLPEPRAALRDREVVRGRQLHDRRPGPGRVRPFGRRPARAAGGVDPGREPRGQLRRRRPGQRRADPPGAAPSVRRLRVRAGGRRPASIAWRASSCTSAGCWCFTP